MASSPPFSPTLSYQEATGQSHWNRGTAPNGAYLRKFTWNFEIQAGCHAMPSATRFRVPGAGVTGEVPPITLRERRPLCVKRKRDSALSGFVAISVENAMITGSTGVIHGTMNPAQNGQQLPRDGVAIVESVTTCRTGSLRKAPKNGPMLHYVIPRRRRGLSPERATYRSPGASEASPGQGRVN